MDDLDLKSIWQDSQKENWVEFNAMDLSKSLTARLDRFSRQIKRNAYLEIAVAPFVALFFAYQAFAIPFLWSKIGAVIIIASMALIVLKLLLALKQKECPIDDSTLGYLQQRKKYLDRQKDLVSKVLYWYVLPTTSGVAVFISGFPLSITVLIVCYSIVLLISVFIYYVNKRAETKHFEPLLNELEELITELKNNNEKHA